MTERERERARKSEREREKVREGAREIEKKREGERQCTGVSHERGTPVEEEVSVRR